MRIVSVADIKARFSAYLKESEAGPIVITRNGRPAAMLLAVTDEEEIERVILAYSPKFQGLLQAAKKEIRETGGMGQDDFWQEVESEAA